MMPSEWAMKKAQAVEGTFNCTSSPKPLILAIAAEIDAARAQGRREGLEEAAQIALTEAAHLDGLNERMAKGADRVAIAIRARIAQEPIADRKQRSPIAWRYKVLVNRHSTGDPLPGEIFMLDIYRTKVWGIPGAWRYSDGPDKPDVDWMCEAEPLFASQEPII